MPDVIDKIIDWLLERAIEDAELAHTLAGLSERLLAAGVPVCRVVIGRGMAHPVIGLASLLWRSDQPQVEYEVTPPAAMDAERMRATPFGELVLTGQEFLAADLTDATQRQRFKLFEDLAADGVSHYFGAFRNFDRAGKTVTDPTEIKGVVLAFCTKRKAGFTREEIDGFRWLIPAICVCVRVAIDRALVSELLDRYLGRISGARVLTGQTARGDGSELQCALLYSDMRNSLELAQGQAGREYLQLLNSYFDCTAGSVLDHGGEVLKFIGDGILAIFPFEDDERPSRNMCRTALAAARDAFHRAHDQPGVQFGVSLCVGRILYGNVGTERRLDFTATGASVGLASRCEEYCKTLDVDIVATKEFVELAEISARDLGSHVIRGFPDPIQLFAYGADLTQFVPDHVDLFTSRVKPD